MFIAHLPAGYLATRFILRRHPARSRCAAEVMALGMADDRRQVHHAYLPHLPLFWLAVFAVAALCCRCAAPDAPHGWR